MKIKSNLLLLASNFLTFYKKPYNNMEALRFQVVGEAFKKKPLDVQTPSERPCDYFGKKVFTREKMFK